MQYKHIYLLISILVAFACIQAKAANAASEATKQLAQALTKSQQYQISLRTKDNIKPPIGDYHAWVITVKDLQDKPTESVRFNIKGGMPGHGHGLPSQPKVTQYLGNGQYLVEGMLFGMAGDWQLNVLMMIDQQSDSVEFNFHVDY